MEPYEYCQSKAAVSGSSSYYSFLFLPQDRRRAVTALYAFRSELADAVDECTDASVARTKLAWWRKELASAFHGTPQHPVARALAEIAPRYNLTEERLNEIIDGIEMDLLHNRYSDFESLTLYCHRVASVVGLLSAEIFGYRDRRTLEYAADLGMAFQLTHIIREVGENARRDRIYLPLDELERHGVSTTDILNARQTEDFARLMDFQVERAFSYYRSALEKLPAEDRRAQRSGIVMAAIYQTMLDEIRRDGCQVLKHRISLTPIRKLWIAWKTWITN
ncbi:MAG TPA: presqualene diphosphate synthase HpnD [Burkholderiales bacterium]|nr:presqualene diphosphate synthase HpnD [Burkholderiales bacterium]